MELFWISRFEFVSDFEIRIYWRQSPDFVGFVSIVDIRA